MVASLQQLVDLDAALAEADSDTAVASAISMFDLSAQLSENELGQTYA